MEKFLIHGGRKLSGTLDVERAKNAVLPLLAGAILTDEEVVIKKCPKIFDVLNMIEILKKLGVDVKYQDDSLLINSKNLNSCHIPYSLGKELRSSVFMLGALLGREKKARLCYPGGCNIGLRPIDIHIEAFKKLGVKIQDEGGELCCSVKKIKGREIYLDFPSVGATENIMLLSVLGEGKTEIHNPAKEPEIVDLMNFLNSMGARIYGAGTSIILIEGVKKLHGTTYLPMPDRIEAGTYLIASAITGGEIELRGIKAKNISSLIHKLCDNSCKITIKNDIIYLKSGSVKNPFDFITAPYPGFPTDLQAQTMALLCVSDGVSLITENIFETRFNHVSELIRMGADVSVKGRTAMVRGVKRLCGADVYAKDLRGGAALVLAGLVAEGVTTVNGVYHMERGYLNMDEKLRSLGANVIRK